MASILDKPRVLVFVSYYLPGYKAGGPLRTIVNMIDHLSPYFSFHIVTRDRDLGDVTAYKDVPSNSWVKKDNYAIYYCSPDKQGFREIVDIINNTDHDMVYLNSFFDPTFTARVLCSRFLGMIQKKPLVLAPRGEFSQAALKLKSSKKRVYIFLSKLFGKIGLYTNVYWQASSQYESQDIINSIPLAASRIKVAIDLPEKPDESKLGGLGNKVHSGRSLSIVFLSRISPMKNLDYALGILKEVKASIVFDIYGPLEDKKYWAECEQLIKLLPSNVQVKYRGSVKPEDVCNVFSQYDLFFFPTRGENYGHVIAEALSVGTSVLLSDKTPWKNLAKDGLGLEIPLNESVKFVEQIEKISELSLQERSSLRASTQIKALDRLNNNEAVNINKNLFNSILSI